MNIQRFRSDDGEVLRGSHLDHYKVRFDNREQETPVKDSKAWWRLIPYDPDNKAWDQEYFFCNYGTGYVWTCDEHEGHDTHSLDFAREVLAKNKDADAYSNRIQIKRIGVEEGVSNLHFKHKNYVVVKSHDRHAEAKNKEKGKRFFIDWDNSFNVEFPKLRTPKHTSPTYLEKLIPNLEDCYQGQIIGGEANDLGGESYLPYFYVNDSEYSPDVQVKKFPVYVLSRYMYFECKAKSVYDNNTGATEETKYSVGFNKTESESMTKTTSLNIGGDFGMTFGNRKKGLPLMGFFKISAGYSRQLSINTSTSEEKLESITRSWGIDASKGNGGALWYYGNRYTLTRLGENKPFMTWKATDPNYKRMRGTDPVYAVENTGN
ncbi:MAG: hypothetical protein NE334_14720 [Lentisphaeraceae bacterium]|nr:hypothetical protein [Lentisphaeraceae bacterium]